MTITQWYCTCVHCFIPCSLLQTMDAPVEPPACASAFSVEAGGLHYSWRGWGREKTITSIGVYDVHTEQWTLRSTTGPSPPGRWDGGCAIIMNHLYIFGGFNKPEWFNDLHKLNLDTFIWSKVHLKHTSIWPKPKQGCVLVPVDGERLICFGGYIGYDCRTNEFHLFDIQEGKIADHHFVFTCSCVCHAICSNQLLQSIGCSCIHAYNYTLCRT